MPQMTKGGKWIFGWVVVGQEREIQVPPAAWAEYGFQAGEAVVFTQGSQRSGGFGLGRAAVIRPTVVGARALAEGVLGEMRARLPEALARPGERLLAFRGSGLALGFLRFGPIYEQALRQPGLESFSVEG